MRHDSASPARRLTGIAALVAVVGLVLLVTLGTVLPAYWVYLLQAVAIGALIARGIGVVTNRAGLITLCQLSFAAIGGWVVAAVALEAPETPFPLLVLLGGATAAPVGLVLGWVTARIRGVEFAVVTLGFAAALDLVMRQGAFPGVGAGTPVIPTAPFDDVHWFFALAWGVLIAAQLAVWAIGRTRFGLGWAALRSSERAAAALGVRVASAKAGAFGVGALLAGMAGGLLAGQYGLLTPDVFSPLTSMVHLATAVLCGAGLFAGAVLAGVFGVFVPELLRRVGLPLDVAQALLALGAFDVLRRGSGGIAEQLQRWLHDRVFRRVRVGCDLGTQSVADPADPAALSAAPVPETPALEVTGVTVQYGSVRVLDEVSLSLAAGEVHALIGPNGAGKSTLVDVVTGFVPSSAGQLRMLGHRLDGVSARRRANHGLRRTFQQSQAVEALTVDAYLRLAGGGAHGAAATDGPEARARQVAVRELFGLPDGAVPIRLMDVGSRRLLEIAAALVSGPRVLLLDEPAAGLDEAESRALAERLRRIPAAFGAAVLLIEHDMEVVRAAATRTTVLDDGRVIAHGATATVLNDPRVIAAYLGREVTA